MSRRGFLKIGVAAAALAACSRVPGAQAITSSATATIATHTATPSVAPTTQTSTAATAPLRQPALDWLAANRLMFGPRPGDLAHIDQVGIDAFIEEQLAAAPANDADLTRRLQALTTLNQSPSELAAQKPRDILLQLQQATLLRAIYSPRQLYEVMVDFWTNHLNIYFGKNADRYLKTVDDHAVIRPHALGKFRDLLGASAHSPAMLVYLDNTTNRKGSPNENYARELMELHTLGVDGGYTQDDVKAVARAFTGWTVRGPKAGGGQAGQFMYNPRQHDDDAKGILGQGLPAGGGQQDGERVLDMLANHPSCATFISAKLARRFISDQPPASVILRTADAFRKSNGDITVTLSALLHSDEFKQSTGQKLKRPLEFVASTLRALNADTDGGAALQGTLTQMGQPLFLWQSPNGFPDANGAWTGADAVLARWNFGLALGANALRGTHVDGAALTAGNAATMVDTAAQCLYGATLPGDVRALLEPYNNDPAVLLALLVAAPLFQTRG
jgi:uncharacterized protein (DUF1800 family)